MTDNNVADTGLNRRQVMQTIGGGAIAGFGGVLGSGTAAAQEDDWSVEKLSPKEEGQLRGRVLSSAVFKAIRRSTRERGFRPDLGNATGFRVTNEEEDVERLAFKAPCEVSGGEDDSEKAAVLYGLESDDRMQARCISKVEGEPAVVEACVGSPSDRGSGKDMDITRFQTLPKLGGEE